ncbi:hypothetical protein B4O97_04030 [Marispirochaeta aestuarii]|uniref:Uncharacterized protein n=1 Tax=Marispirochaeta aestuarii TaxID=1963862 RepID=A0A1Y1S1I5_9SPIO|nr:N-6 DNA methylase [Marispirochaeta aestuarii]ORC37368.1 hypothetical protein B4O97_04030 [Marispirochaeta aestuarii]
MSYSLSNSANVSVKKRNGVYYTPTDIADALALWAIRNEHDTVIDPSFGSGVFLQSAFNRLRNLGVSNPSRQIVGVEIDSAAATSIAFVRKSLAQSKLMHTDFLRLTPSDVGGLYSVIIGNPPYVRHHLLRDAARLAAEQSCSRGEVSRRASYWAYFVVHSLRFIRPGGHLAFVLPGAFLHANYAERIRTLLASSFASLQIIRVIGTVFPEAQEESILVLGENRQDGCAKVILRSMERHKIELQRTIHSEDVEITLSRERPADWHLSSKSSGAASVLEILRSQYPSFGSRAHVRIGAVTGAKRFFVMSLDEAIDRGIESDCLVPIVARAKQVHGLQVTGVHNNWAEDRFGKLFLFSPPLKGDCPSGAQAYIEYGEREGIHRGHKCSSRHPWYIVPGTSPPDAFLTYTSGTFVCLSLNRSGVACTNTLHAVTFLDKTLSHQRMVAVGMLSTPAQLSAEIVGRRTGGGALRLDPSDVLELLSPDGFVVSSEKFHRLDALCRSGHREKASLEVDDMLVAAGLDPKILQEARDAHHRLLQERQRPRSPSTS